MTATEQFILDHRHDDVRRLAFLGDKHPEVDMPYALDQIQGWQTACHKLPTWAATDGIVYPPHLNMEQCSSEFTARYKASVLGQFFLRAPHDILSRAIHDSSFLANDPSLFRASHHCSLPSPSALRIPHSVFIDLTGGFGVDFTFLSQIARQAVYVERNEHLCSIARHNFALLDMTNATVVCADAVRYLHDLPRSAFRVPHSTIIFLDPARRDVHGKKVFGMEDCTPDVLQLAPELMAKADVVMLKLSPMLDWHEAVRQLSAAVRHGDNDTQLSMEVHIVSVRNECKELLLVMHHGEAPLQVFCVNDAQRFVYRPSEGRSNPSSDGGSNPSSEGGGTPSTAGVPSLPSMVTEEELLGEASPRYLFVPNSSIMKAGCFDEIARFYRLRALGQSSHLFVADRDVTDFPGRRFLISAISSMNKKSLRQHLQGITQANIATRNFPLSVADLRKRLKLKEGGNCFIFATTVAHSHLLIIAKPVA